MILNLIRIRKKIGHALKILVMYIEALLTLLHILWMVQRMLKHGLHLLVSCRITIASQLLWES